MNGEGQSVNPSDGADSRSARSMGSPTAMTDVGELDDLVGRELSGVSFIRSYVELHFDGPVVRSLAPPLVRKGEHAVKFGDPGSRDALCSLIGLVVSRIDDLPATLRIGFGEGTDFEIPKASPGVGAEVAHFVPVVEGRPDVAGMSIWENVVPTRGD